MSGLDEVERLIANDLLANEYKGGNPDQIQWLSEAAARRIVKLLQKSGYRIARD